ncbi:MAG: hypothetical protein IPH07_14220 [Deltaproteobacteria bacterium]|nr:hypothetical protein [Deltaproteobacteria bacterium]
MNGDGGGDVGLSEADAVAEHRAAVGVELGDEALRGLTLIGGGLVTLCRGVQRALLADHAPDVIEEHEPRLLARVALIERRDAAHGAGEVGVDEGARFAVPLPMRRRRERGLRVPMAPFIARANVAEREVRTEVEQHLGEQ